MKRRVFKLSLATAVVLTMVFAALLHFKRSSSRATLERYKAELLAKGEVLSLAKLAGLPSTNAAEVAARQGLNALSITVPAGTFDLPEYAAPGKVRVAWGKELRLMASSSSNTSPSWEEFAAFNAGPIAALDQVRSAFDTPPADTGFTWTDDYDQITAWKGNFVHDRSLAQVLQNGIMQNLHGTNLEAACADLHELIQLAQMNRNEVTLVSQMIRDAIGAIGLADTWQALQAPGWDDAKLAALQKDWEGLDFVANLERGIKGERAWGQIIMAKVRKSSARELILLLKKWKGTVARSVPGTVNGSLPAAWNGFVLSYVEPVAYKAWGMHPDELLQLQFETKTLEAVRELQKGRPWLETARVLTNLNAEINARLDADKSYRYLLSALRIPSFNRATQTSAEYETRKRLTLLAIAIKRYQLKHGAAPPSLAALVPEFISAVPIDPMSGKGLRYRLNADGTFVLYSVGEDGVDDGGDPAPVLAGKPDMWNAKDAVWPMPASEEEAAAADRKR